MKAIKKITALVLVGLITLSLSACIHKKNEIAVKIGDVEFTSAYYMCALIGAKAEAQSKVQEKLSDEELNSGEEIDYYSKKIDKKSFTDWVEDKALESLKEIAAYKTLCKENKLELTKEEKEEAQQAVTYYWDNYGYSAYFEPNGVSRETYAKYSEDGYYAEAYFQSVYGKEGKKALKTEDVNKEITDNYIIADQIQISYKENATTADKAKDKQTLEDYIKQINSGKKTFIDIYKTHNEIKDEATAETDDKDEVKPINTYATVLGAEETSFANDYYDIFKKYEYDVPTIVETTDKTGIILVIKRDISKDQYYMDYLDAYARHAIADEDFEKEIADYVKKLEVDVNGYATGQFKVKKIIEPTATY